MHIEKLVRKEVKSLDPYVPSQSIQEVEKKLGLDGVRVVNLSTNESVLGASDIVRKALQLELKNIHHYPDGSSRPLREDLGNRYGIDPEMIIVTNGGDELLFLLGSCFISAGDEVMMGEYGFKTYESVSQLTGGEIIAVPLKDKHLDLTQVGSRVSQKTKMIFLCNPHNPNGTMFTHQQLAAFLDRIPTTAHPVIVLDEAYFDFVESDEFPDSIELIKKSSHPIIVLRTFSKIGGMAGLRIGFGMARPELIHYLKSVQAAYSVNSMAQAAARAFLSDDAYRQKLLQNNKKGKVFLYQQFDQLKLSYTPTQANFIFVDVREDADLFCEKMMAEGVIVRSGKIWGCDHHIRITIGTEEQNRKFIQVLSDILSKGDNQN